jgi:hypothetical protein
LTNQGLEQRAVLVNFSKSTWTGEAPDKSADKDIQEKRGNEAGTTRTTKYLVNEIELKKNNKAFNACYLFYLENTTPWETKRGGARLLPGGNYERFMTGMSELIDRANDRADEFCEIYPRLIEEYRPKLNGLFDPRNYPSRELIRSKFSINISECPLPISPESLTLRFMGAEKLAALKERLANSWNAQEAAAMGDLYKRLAQAVGHVAKTLADPTAIFRDSLVNNIQELADLIPGLNFQNDPELAELAELARGKLAAIPAETLRTDLKVRGQIAGEAGELLSKITGAGGRFIDLS